MNSLVIILGAGYFLVLATLIMLCFKVLFSEELDLGWKNLLLFLFMVLGFMALTTVIWIASNIQNWVR